MSYGHDHSRRATVAWCLFDFANSAYTTLIITVTFAVYFRQVVVNATDNRGDQLWGLANFIAMLVVALASPVLGALADYSGRKKLFLIFATLVSVAATALLNRVGPGDIVPAVTLFILGTLGFETGYVFYNAFLQDVSTPETMGRISCASCLQSGLPPTSGRRSSIAHSSRSARARQATALIPCHQ